VRQNRFSGSGEEATCAPLLSCKRKPVIEKRFVKACGIIIKRKSKLRELEIKGEVEGASLALTESCCK